jgi:hypothetical protein
MLLAESAVGSYRIYAAALDGPDGYAAAVAVCRREQAGMREAWRDLDLGCGQRWTRSEDALRFAIGRARELLANRAP